MIEPVSAGYLGREVEISAYSEDRFFVSEAVLHEIIEETDQTDEPALAQIEQKYYPAYGNRMLSPNEVMIPIDDVDDFNREIIFMLVPKRQEQMEELVWPLSHLSGR